MKKLFIALITTFIIHQNLLTAYRGHDATPERKIEIITREASELASTIETLKGITKILEIYQQRILNTPKPDTPENINVITQMHKDMVLNIPAECALLSAIVNLKKHAFNMTKPEDQRVITENSAFKSSYNNILSRGSMLTMLARRGAERPKQSSHTGFYTNMPRNQIDTMMQEISREADQALLQFQSYRQDNPDFAFDSFLKDR